MWPFKKIKNKKIEITEGYIPTKVVFVTKECSKCKRKEPPTLKYEEAKYHGELDFEVCLYCIKESLLQNCGEIKKTIME